MDKQWTNAVCGQRKKPVNCVFTDFSIGRAETPPKIFATQEDEDGIRLLPCPVPKPQPPIVCKTEDMMITVIIVGKGCLKEEMSGRE